MDLTNEFSFILKPSTISGVGVFAMYDIKEGTHMRLFGDGSYKDSFRKLKYEDVPDFFETYCLYKEDGVLCPPDFGQMFIGWYLNHSSEPNIFHKDYQYYANRDIKAGEEIFVDYNSFNEPEKFKSDYYKRG